MEKRMLSKPLIGLGILMAMVLFLAMDCTFTITTTEFKTANLTATVIDSRATETTGVSGVEVTILDELGVAVNAVVELTDEQGEFTLPQLLPGNYTLEFSKPGWFIPSQEVSVRGSNSSLSRPIPAFELNEVDVFGITAIVVWETATHDVDLYVSVVVDNQFSTKSGLAAVDMPYGVASLSSDLSIERIYHGNMKSDSKDGELSAVEMFGNVKNSEATGDDRNTGYGPETATIRFIPTENIGGTNIIVMVPNNSGLDANGLFAAFPGKAGDQIEWVGYANIYLDIPAANSGSTRDFQEAKPTVYLLQTLKDEDDELIPNFLGKISVEFPGTTTSIARINFLDDGDTDLFQILPNYQLQFNGPGSGGVNFRSVDNSNSQIIGVVGRNR